MLKKAIQTWILVGLFTATVNAQTAAEKYVQLYREAAVKTMNEHGVPASIVLGVAIHESASGTSKIARYLNNHFGLKGKSGPKSIPSSYKGYASVDDCYQDFVSILKRRFSGLFGRYSSSDYQSWAMGIQRGGYAASRSWASQVMGIIKKYRLYEYDTPLTPVILTQQATAVVPVQEFGATPEPVSYIVKKGDTLIEIARKFNSSVSAIKSKNGLKTSYLSIGQKLSL
jgi:LysM repeat protein